MDKKSRIIMIICIIIIVIGIGIATSIAIIKNKTEKVKINKDETIVEKQIPSPGIKAYKGSNVYLN